MAKAIILEGKGAGCWVVGRRTLDVPGLAPIRHWILFPVKVESATGAWKPDPRRRPWEIANVGATRREIENQLLSKMKRKEF